MREIVLASSSPRRSELLKQIGVAFRVVPADIEENIDPCMDVGQLAESLSYKKASHTAVQLTGSCLSSESLPAAYLHEVTTFSKAQGMKAFENAAQPKVKSASYLVIGADTIVVKDGVLGKPQSEEHARKMLKALQGGWHEVITGVSVIDTGNAKSLTGYETTRVKMRELTDAMVDSYIKTGEPMDKAGAYGIQGMGAILVEKIEGCYFNVVGLPLTRLSKMFEHFGVCLL